MDARILIDSLITARLADTSAFATAEPSGKPPSAGCIKMQSMVDSIAQRARDAVPKISFPDDAAYKRAQDAAVDAALTGKDQQLLDEARALHAQFIGRLRTELQAPVFAALVGPAAQGDDAALGQIQALMETEEFVTEDRPVFDDQGKETGRETVVVGTRGVPIARVSDRIPYGRNGCRRDAITEALRGA